MEWDFWIAVEVHGSASTVGISAMVMVVVLLKVVAVDGSRGSDVLEWGSKKWEPGVCGLVDQPGHHPPATAPAVSPNNTSLSGLSALSSSYKLLHKL